MNTGGYSCGRSIALELGVALSAAGPHLPESNRSPDLAAMLGTAPDEWRALWPEMLGAPRRWVSVLTHAALLAGVLREEAYSRATLAMREFSIAQAVAAAAALAAPYGITADCDLPPDRQLVRLMGQLQARAWERLGLPERTSSQEDPDLLLLPRILAGGDLQHRFWHWLDRAYYEFYRPWREQRLPVMQALEQRAAAGLGPCQGAGAPATAWLPAPNPLRILPELGVAVAAGRTDLFFWADPFGLFDFWACQPGLLIVTYHEPGALFDHFREDAIAVAERIKALADPTRLMLLRIIRHFGMDNTQMADYLGLARPTVSIHAKLLREAGLIESSTQGRQALHRINAAEVRRLFADLERFLDLPPDQEDQTR